MDEMCCWLNQHQEIRTVAYVIENGTPSDYERVRIVLRNSNAKKVIVAGFFRTEEIQDLTLRFKKDQMSGVLAENVVCDFIELDDLKRPEGTWALYVDLLNSASLLKFADLEPDYLLASIWKSRVSAFKVWEAYRKCAKHVQIRTLIPGKVSKMLVWDRDESTDVELSVILPTYNVSKYLNQCITSLTEWKAPYLEFLFVNDGSPDDSRDVILEWSKKDPRVKLIDKPNGGCASARQMGMELAKGKYIGFIDPDDFIEPCMYSKLLSAAMEGSYEVAYCGYNEYYENDNSVRRVPDMLGEPFSDGLFVERDVKSLAAFLRVAIWRGIYSRELIDRAKLHFYTDLRRFDDLPFKVEVFASAKSAISVPEYLYYYRLSRPGQDVSADDERLYVHFDIFKHLNESIVSRGDQELTDYLQLVKIQTHLYALSKIKPEFRDHYIQEAKKDLLTTGEFERTYKLAKDKIGKENADKYRDIMNG